MSRAIAWCVASAALLVSTGASAADPLVPDPDSPDDAAAEPLVHAKTPARPMSIAIGASAGRSVGSLVGLATQGFRGALWAGAAISRRGVTVRAGLVTSHERSSTNVGTPVYRSTVAGRVGVLVSSHLELGGSAGVTVLRFVHERRRDTQIFGPGAGAFVLVRPFVPRPSWPLVPVLIASAGASAFRTDPAKGRGKYLPDFTGSLSLGVEIGTR